MAKKKDKSDAVQDKYLRSKIRPEVKFIAERYGTNRIAADTFSKATGISYSTFLDQLIDKPGYCTRRVGEAIKTYADQCREKKMPAVERTRKGRQKVMFNGENEGDKLLDGDVNASDLDGIIDPALRGNGTPDGEGFDEGDGVVYDKEDLFDMGYEALDREELHQRIMERNKRFE